MSPCGFLLKMVIDPALISSSDTILAERPAIDESSLLDRENGSFFEPMQQTLFSSGGTSDIDTIGSKASTAQSFETRARTRLPSLSDRLTQSLITAGLVRGITPSSIRNQSGAAIRDFASLPLVGGGAGEQRKACLSLRGSHD